MNELCTDVGYVSLNKQGEQLCGDHVEIVEQVDGSLVIVLADGLGSGVKASILATLTSKIISTMIANGLTLEDCVYTIAATLPICAERQVAYSTFTILRIADNTEAELIQYDNPHTILLRDGKHMDYPEVCETIDGKNIYKSRISLRERDVLLAMSDGVLHASQGKTMNTKWNREAIVEFLEILYNEQFTAKTWAAMLVGECARLYGDKPGDDTSACAIRLRRREVVNVLFGPPQKREDTEKMLSLFFAKAGKRIICGGTTGELAAEFLKKPLDTSLPAYLDPVIPPTARLEGVDLVTEGAVTMARVLEYAEDYAGHNARYLDWSCKKDGASQIARMLFEDATDINFYVGRAVNEAHQKEGLPITFHVKMQIAERLSKLLLEMGKRVNVSYF
ncbi:MAG: SpoIIE family protein phosphatase [Candidatus Pelethousia sp.]|nr:SpoIIE family protein phosphatase [Candidatus Pelethousia sp.]